MGFVIKMDDGVECEIFVAQAVRCKKYVKGTNTLDLVEFWTGGVAPLIATLGAGHYNLLIERLYETGKATLVSDKDDLDMDYWMVKEG